MRSAVRAIALFVLAFVSLVEAKACSPDTCGLAVRGKHGLSSKDIARHRNDCSSFLSVTVIPPTSTIYVTAVKTAGTVRDTVRTLSSTETDTLTLSATVTDVVTVSGATTLHLTATTTTTTTSTLTSTSTTATTSTYTSATTTTTSTTDTTTATLTNVATTTTTDLYTITVTKLTTSTSTFLSTHIMQVTRRAVGPAHDAVTILPSKIPNYASKACGRGTASYSSACAAWGIKLRTTTKPTPRTTVHSKTLATATVYTTAHTTVTLDVEITNTATVDSTVVTSSTDVEVSSATETDTLTSSATATTTSTIPTAVTSTETDTSSARVATVVLTATTTTDIIRTTATASTTTTAVVPWCTDNALKRALGGCAQSQYMTYCNIAISPLMRNPLVYQAHQLGLDNCIGICDSNDWCTSGMFNSATGLCSLYLYAGSDYVQLVPTTDVVQTFEVVYGSTLYFDCDSYECPDASYPECCGGMGCADVLPPYGP